MKRTPFKSLQIKDKDLEALKVIAEIENRSMAAQVAHWIKQYQQHLLKESA